MSGTGNISLPEEFDVIVVGTGLCETIVAAACSRIGLQVLHLDRNDYYSGEWAAFNLHSFHDWMNNQNEPKQLAEPQVEELASLLKEGEELFNLTANPRNVFTDISFKYHIPTTSEQDGEGDQVNCENPENIVKTSVSAHAKSSQTDIDTKSTADEGVSGKDAVTVFENNVTSSGNDDSNVEQNNVDLSDVSCSLQKEDNETVGSSKLDTSLHALIKSQWRRFSLDLTPKVLWSRGSLVELLIKSDVAKYCEFRCLSRVLTRKDGNLLRVPCSRSDVFTSKEISMLEKRMLMKLLTMCLKLEEEKNMWEEYAHRPFSEFLSSQKVTALVQHHVIYAIAMVSPQTPTLQALQQTRKFLESLGRYGNSPFLIPMYGSGELPQAFSRLCAVFGGIYCLRRTASCIVKDQSGSACGIICNEGQRIKSRWVVCEAASLPASTTSTRQICRAVILTNRSILDTEKDDHTLMRLPPVDTITQPTTLLELHPNSGACPKGMCLVHLTTIKENGSSSSEYFAPIINQLFSQNDGDSRPRLLFSIYFTHNSTSVNTTALPDNLAVCPAPSANMDYENSVLAAKSIFERMCPDEEFLPRAPNPEDIILDETTSEPGFASSDGEKRDNTQSVKAQATDEPQQDDEISSSGTCISTAGDQASHPVDQASHTTDQAIQGESAKH